MKKIVLYSFLMFSFVFYGQVKSSDFKKSYKNYYINDGFSKTGNRSVDVLAEFQKLRINLTIDGELITLLQIDNPMIGKDRNGETYTLVRCNQKKDKEILNVCLYDNKLIVTPTKLICGALGFKNLLEADEGDTYIEFFK
jgi:hypothetical protein